VRSYLSRYGLPVALVLAYLYSFPYFAEIQSANELPRVYLTQAMVEEGTFAIDTGVRRWGTTADVSPHEGRSYSNKAPGSSFLAVPAYLVLRAVRGGDPGLAEMTWAFRVTTGIVPTLLFLLLLWRFLGRFAPRSETRRLTIAAYALGTMAMTYSVLFIAHQLAAVCIATAYILIVWVVEDGLDRRWLWAAGLAAGCAPLVDYQAAFAGVPIAVYLLYHTAVRARQWKPAAMAAAGAVPPIALLFYYHWRCFGSPFRTGYDASESFAHFHQEGFLGMDGLRWEAFVGSTVAPDNGLLFFCPMLLLAIPGWVILARRRQWWHLGITLAVVVGYLLFISSLTFWRGGWQLGPRYITAMLPFAMVPVAVALAAAEARWWTRGAALGLILVGVVVYAVSAGQYPHFPEKFFNPLYEVTFRLIADGHAPYNAGWLVGLRGLPSLVPYLALLFAVVVYVALPSRRHWRSAALGAALAAAILASYSLAPGGGPAADRAYERWVAGVMPR
jgi:4-amino-4-deoxy-L-arabinose transferase-like glycosyltransferase